MSAFLVPTKTRGLQSSATVDSLGVRGLGCSDLSLDAVFVPDEALLGQPGEGFRLAMWALDGGRAAMAKLYASEAAHRAADKVMQILASAGYRRGSTVEKLFRNVRATEIYQGTSEVQKMVIAAHVVGEL